VPLKLRYIPGQVFGLGIRNKRHTKRQIKWEAFEELLRGVRYSLLVKHRNKAFRSVRYVWVYLEFGKKKPGKIGALLQRAEARRRRK